MNESQNPYQNPYKNPYQAPRADVRAAGGDQGVTTEMAEILGQGAFWARLLSIVNFISLGMGVVGTLLSLLSMTAVAFGSAIGNIPSLIMTWFYAISMHRYAGSAKRLRSDPNETDVAECFASFSTYLKVTGVLFILMIVIAVIGIVAAVLLPAIR